jgi:hypothetical protein
MQQRIRNCWSLRRVKGEQGIDEFRSVLRNTEAMISQSFVEAIGLPLPVKTLKKIP